MVTAEVTQRLTSDLLKVFPCVRAFRLWDGRVFVPQKRVSEEKTRKDLT